MEAAEGGSANTEETTGERGEKDALDAQLTIVAAFFFFQKGRNHCLN